MQHKQRPTAKNAKLTFRRKEIPTHPGTDSPELSLSLCESGLCKSYILDAARTNQALPSRLTPFHPPWLQWKSSGCWGVQGCLGAESGDFIALDARHINMLSRLPDCSVVPSHRAGLGLWVRELSNYGWMGWVFGGQWSDTMCAYRKFECSCCYCYCPHSGSQLRKNNVKIG